MPPQQQQRRPSPAPKPFVCLVPTALLSKSPSAAVRLHLVVDAKSDLCPLDAAARKRFAAEVLAAIGGILPHDVVSRIAVEGVFELQQGRGVKLALVVPRDLTSAVFSALCPEGAAVLAGYPVAVSTSDGITARAIRVVGTPNLWGSDDVAAALQPAFPDIVVLAHRNIPAAAGFWRSGAVEMVLQGPAARLDALACAGVTLAFPECHVNLQFHRLPSWAPAAAAAAAAAAPFPAAAAAAAAAAAVAAAAPVAPPPLTAPAAHVAGPSGSCPSGAAVGTTAPSRPSAPTSLAAPVAAAAVASASPSATFAAVVTAPAPGPRSGCMERGCWSTCRCELPPWPPGSHLDGVEMTLEAYEQMLARQEHGRLRGKSSGASGGRARPPASR
jgi:hypothetical protein